jgi:excinuclease ABC subunit C
MTRISPDLDLKLKNLPTSPGVYLFKDVQKRIIYIGKAKNLRNRVKTYFQTSHHPDSKTAALMAHVRDFDLIETHNEIESLILEANLVHENSPRYNIRLKDDKHFPYLKVTVDEMYPRIQIVRRLEKDGARYFGPYTSANSMRKTAQFLVHLFKVRNCRLIIPHPKGRSYKVCLDYHIGRCGGPCEGFQTPESYRQNINSLLMALSGKTRDLIANLTSRMETASAEMKYEEAKQLRDQIEAIKNTMIKQHVDINQVTDQDIVAVARERADATAVVMQIRDGVLIGRQEFTLEILADDTDDEVLRTFLTQYYNHQPNLPDEIMLTEEIEEMKLLEDWLKEIKGSSVKILLPKIGDKVRLLELAKKNARLVLDERLIRKQAVAERTSKMVVSLKDELGLDKSPRTMVCFDISNTGETDSVGSCVYFDNGKPKKSEYRHFRIKGVKGQDDFKMMREIIGRYFHRLREEKKQPPDLVVVDGGKGQLSSATAELTSLGFGDQSIISLAKRLEEVYLPDQSDPITIPKSSPALMLLKRIRDEAHRFAITFNRTVRTKRTIQSALDGIAGVGPSKRDALLKQFGSVEQIRQKSVEELTAVKGITAKLAQAILAHLKASM